MPAKVSQGLMLTSPAFGYGEPIPGLYSYRGGNKSPELTWYGAPEGTKTCAIFVEDTDARNFCHWVVFNIPATMNTMSGGVPKKNLSTSAIVQGRNDFGNTGYDGPDPPSGTHHYYFRLYALDTKLDLSESAGREQVLKAMKGHILASTDHMGTYWK